MPAFKHILFPVDFSERCRAIRPFVMSMARQFHSKLTLLHVIDMPIGWYGDGLYPVAFDVPEVTEDARERLDTFFEPAGASVAIERIVEQGEPGYEITSFSERHEVDLIMMPTHGYGRFRGLLLGSVTAKVLHDAKCGVWTSTHVEDPNLSNRLHCKSILCAIDLAPESVDLIRYANDLAQTYSAELRLVHAVTAAETRPEKSPETEFRRFLLQFSSGEIAKLQQQAGASLDVCIEGGGVSTVVREAALHHDADLIVIGRGRLHHAFGRLRTNSYAIIRDSPCPVLSV